MQEEKGKQIQYVLHRIFGYENCDFEYLDDCLYMTIQLNGITRRGSSIISMRDNVNLNMDDINIEVDEYGLILSLIPFDITINIPTDVEIDKNRVKATHRNGILDVVAYYKGD